MTNKIINPLTGRKMGDKPSELVANARDVRRNAKKQARSGHPGRRAEARQVLANVPEYIHNVYKVDASS